MSFALLWSEPQSILTTQCLAFWNSELLRISFLVQLRIMLPLMLKNEPRAVMEKHVQHNV